MSKLRRLVHVSLGIGWLLGMALVPASPTFARSGWQGCGSYRITAYFATGSRTATGYWPYVGELAVDPSVIPLYAYVRISGLGPDGSPRVFRALDTGGLVTGPHLDLFATSWDQAYYFQGGGYRSACWRRG